MPETTLSSYFLTSFIQGKPYLYCETFQSKDQLKLLFPVEAAFSQVIVHPRSQLNQKAAALRCVQLFIDQLKLLFPVLV